MEGQQEEEENAPPIESEAEVNLSKSRVEKLKRRIIRAVAAKTSQNPDDNEMENMWEMMKRNSKCDCKLLWKHMRAVTLKKLNRLLPAEDRIENITAIARLTITDWLLFDLVLVHENIDVIGLDLWEKGGEEPEPLMELFFLVDEYRIEQLAGTDLIDAWLKLTREYNDGGRKCSPMLLQRRWYQMKEAARKRFYDFWRNYRGNPVLMQKAKRFQPTALQVDIVRKNKSLIVNAFTEWNKLIESGKVILASDFDNRINAQRKGSSTDTAPELELVEQFVETISLEGDSDEDDSKDSICQSSIEKTVTIKREPHDEDLIEIQENPLNIPCENQFRNNEEDPPPPAMSNCKETGINEETRLVVNSNQGQNKENADNSQSACDDSDILEESCNIDNEVTAFANNVLTDCTDIAANTNNLEACNDSSDSDDVELIDIFNSSKLVIETPFLNQSSEVDVIKQENYIKTEINGAEATEQCQEQSNLDFLPRIENVTSIAESEPTSTENQDKIILAQKANELALNKNCCLTEINNSSINDLSKVVMEEKVNDRELLGNFELPSDIQFVDDGIVIDDDEDEEVKVKVEETSEETQSSKIDLKLLLFPIVYTKKIDHMDVFKFIDYDHIRDGRVIECASVESKPVDSRSIKLEDISPLKDEELHANVGSDPSDQEDTLLKTECDQKLLSTEIEFQSNTASALSDEEEVPLNTLKNRVHINSWLLKKPRVLNYNPIKLCKNPDFNTRLKRLTAGFLSYERNRKNLKRCYPLTIDLHKAFEDKLTNNTLYLKGVDSIANAPAPSSKDSINVPIPIKSPPLPQNVSTDNETDFIDIISNNPMLCERNKVINLPDITEIRRLHQKLLTAEVAPLQMAAPSTAEIKAIDVPNFEIVDQNKHTIQEVQNNSSTINSLLSSSDYCGINDSPNVDAPVDKSLKTSSESRVSEDSGIIQSITGGGDKSVSGKKQQKLKPYKPLHTYATWYSKPAWYSNSNSREVEFLLASDTVDKMLYLFTGEDMKKKDKTKFMKVKELQKISLKESSVQLDLKESTPTSVTENEKPVNDPSEGALKPKKVTKKKYCCWVRKKIAHPNLRHGHGCLKKPLCTCCCKEKLITSSTQLKDKKQQPPNETIILSDEEEKDLGNKQPTKVCVINIPSNKSFTEFPKSTSIIIDGKANRVNVPKHIIRNNCSSADENDSINCEPNALGEHNETVIPSQSDLQVIQNITDTSDNSSVLPPYEITVGVNETIHMLYNTPQNDIRVYNTEQTALPTIPPLLESLTPDEGTSQITITVKELNQSNSSNGNTLPDHSFPHTVSDITHKSPIQPLASPPLIVPPKPVVARRKTSRPRVKTSTYAMPPKPLQLPNKTVRVKVKKQEKLSSASIFVGENKILLSTVKNPFPCRISIDPPKISLPNGVHFVLLPNNELALSIEPGVELNISQLSHLQSVIQTLQNFLGGPSKSMNIIDTTPIVIDDDESQIEQEINIKYNDHNKEKSNNLYTENKMEDVGQIETCSQSSITNSLIEESNITPLKIENNSFANLNKPENVDTNNVIAPEVSNTEKEFMNDNLEKTSNDVSRKTILSDLMEMSGICEEDAKLPETPILPTTMPDINFIPLEKIQDESVTDMHPDILRLFNSPIALSALVRRPDLNIITTYSDLKYAFQEAAKFFKLDVITGDISPINVFIKKKDNIRSSLNPPKRSRTELIDLTDDDTENDDIVIGSEGPSIHAKDSVSTSDSSDAKPLKLFRAMHPSILRNRMKGTEFIPSAVRSSNLLEKLDGKKIMKIVNLHQRKQNLNEVNMGTVADVEPEEIPESDDSDDEPLAKKAKRNKQPLNAVPCDQQENIERSENIDQYMEKKSLVEVANPIMFEGLDPEFGCVDDCEEDCILGV